MNRYWWLTLLPAYFVLLLTLLFAGPLRHVDLYQVFANPQSSTYTDNPLGLYPSRMTIPSLDLDLQIIEGTYDAALNTWNVSPKAVHFATLSTPPHMAGNTIIYGHNTNTLFGKLDELAVGERIILYTPTHNYTYVYISSDEVSPDQTSIFDAKKVEHQLTLITCSGLFDTKRTLMHFLPEVI